uniref:Uncharacterized protein n=1 Tax=Aliivibrio fischeri TaxID=668 RepID=H2ES19_ALIFS|nr:hypothetical protein [Aliivibrio fischeri]AEY78186.1 hypothetical protein [Aliivibrio fischeri]
MMVIPELVSLPHNGKPQTVLRKLKKAWPSRFSQAFIRDERVCLYISNEAAVVRSELWRDALITRDIDLSSVAILDVVSDSKEVPQLYCVVIENGEVVSQWLQSSLNITENVAILSAKMVLCAVSNESLVFHGQWCLPLTDSEMENLSAYTLKAKKTVWGWALGGGVVALGLGALLMWPEPPPKPVVIDEVSIAPVVIDPWAEYRTVMKDTYSASDTLHQVQNAMAVAQLLPPKWKASQIKVQDGVVIMDIQREKFGQVQLFSAWLEQHSGLTPYVTFSRDGAMLKTPIEKPTGIWSERIIPVEPTQQALLDTLASMKFEVNALDERKGVYQHTSFSLKQSFDLFDVEVLMSLMAPLPMTASDFSLFPASDDGWQGEITFSFYGVNS